MIFAASLAAILAAQPAPQTLYEHGLFYLEGESASGEAYLLFTDTGGGLFIQEASASRLGLERIDGAPRRYSASFLQGNAYPVPPDGVLRAMDEGPPPAPPVEIEGVPPERWDGMLGAQWYAGHVWLFDYAEGRMNALDPSARATLLSSGTWSRADVGVSRDDDGKASGFVRVSAEIGGQSYEMLFDTGAMGALRGDITDSGLQTEYVWHATSFISQSVFDEWRAEHEDWRVIEGGDVLGASPADVIVAPHITIADQTIGPVWFSVKPDRNFSEFMSRFTDQPVTGAIGGSALQYGRWILDFHEETLYGQASD